MDLNITFARNLNRYLSRDNMSQLELAKHLSVSPSAVSAWCTGQKLPRMDKVQAMANLFGVLKSDLIENKPAAKDDDELSAGELELLRAYRAASKEKQDALRLLLEAHQKPSD